VPATPQLYLCRGGTWDALIRVTLAATGCTCRPVVHVGKTITIGHEESCPHWAEKAR